MSREIVTSGDSRWKHGEQLSEKNDWAWGKEEHARERIGEAIRKWVKGAWVWKERLVRGEEKKEMPRDGDVRSRWVGVKKDPDQGARTCKMTQWPFFAARSSAASATTSCPCPKDTL